MGTRSRRQPSSVSYYATAVIAEAHSWSDLLPSLGNLVALPGVKPRLSPYKEPILSLNYSAKYGGYCLIRTSALFTGQIYSLMGSSVSPKHPIF